jgi:hypothetical protein
MKTIKGNQGFTLIETFVAITVLIFAIIGPLQMFSQAIADSNYAKNQITGFYLAAEGLDLAINIKENNMRTIETDPTKSWLNGLPIVDQTDIDPVSLSLESGASFCTAKGCALYLDEMDYPGVYRPVVNTSLRPSIFRRQIKVTEDLPASGQAKVVSSVRWVDRGKEQGVDLVTYISQK